MPVFADQALQLGGFTNVDPVRAVQPAEIGRGVRGGHALHDALRHFDQRYFEVQFSRGGGRFETDVPATDDQQSPSGNEF